MSYSSRYKFDPKLIYVQPKPIKSMLSSYHFGESYQTLPPITNGSIQPIAICKEIIFKNVNSVLDDIFYKNIIIFLDDDN